MNKKIIVIASAIMAIIIVISGIFDSSLDKSTISQTIFVDAVYDPKNNIVKINKCLLDWCSISHENKKGWIEKISLWGVYKYEKINIPFYQPLINQLWKINLNLPFLAFNNIDSDI